MSAKFLVAWAIIAISSVAVPAGSSALVGAGDDEPTHFASGQLVGGMKPTPPDRTITDGEFQLDVVLGKGVSESDARVILRSIRRKELIAVGQQLLVVASAATWSSDFSTLDVTKTCRIAIADPSSGVAELDRLAYEVQICERTLSGRTLILTMRGSTVEVHDIKYYAY